MELMRFRSQSPWGSVRQEVGIHYIFDIECQLMRIDAHISGDNSVYIEDLEKIISDSSRDDVAEYFVWKCLGQEYRKSRDFDSAIQAEMREFWISPCDESRATIVEIAKTLYYQRKFVEALVISEV